MPDQPTEASTGSAGKTCFVCGIDLAGRPRQKDIRGRYLCPHYAKHRERCEAGAGAFTSPTVNDEDILEDLADDRAAKVAADIQADFGGEDDDAGPIGLAPEDTSLPATPYHTPVEEQRETVKGPLSCPVCVKRLPPEAQTCSACGYDARVGLISSRDLRKTKSKQTGERQILCQSCGYDMSASRSMRCPECGESIGRSASGAFDRERESRSTVRMTYLQPAFTLAIAFPIAMGIDALLNGIGEAIWLPLVLLIQVVFGVVALGIASSIWLGWDAPFRLNVLRLAAVYAVGMITWPLLMLIPIPVLPWALHVLIYLGMLMYYFELELSDAIYLGLTTLVVQILVGVALAAVLFANA